MDHEPFDAEQPDATQAPQRASVAGDDTETPSEVDQLRAQLDEAQGRFLRAQADLDNYRKRAQREQETERRYAKLPMLRDLLPVVDNIQRALEAAEQSQEAPSLLEGFKIVGQQLQSVFAQHGCQPIPAQRGDVFDPNQHEAVSHFPSEDYEQGTIVEVTQTGYQLHDRVVRPSQVVVSSGKAQP